MSKTMRLLVSSVAVVAATAAAAPAAHAQDGFALKLGGVFNSSTVEDRETDLRLSDAAGWNVGAEYVFGGGWGVGLSGYTTGSPQRFDTSQGSLVVLADVNRFFRLPLLPITPYVGLHVGLGTYTLQDVQDRVRPQVDFGDRGWQLGVRVQPTALIGLDAQLRRVSGSLAGDQDASFEQRQVVLGVTIF
jgi:opacity protein-like surface antigen